DLIRSLNMRTKDVVKFSLWWSFDDLDCLMVLEVINSSNNFKLQIGHNHFTAQPRGKLCIEVSAASKMATISEELCIGCGICVKKCPFNAIEIINLPKALDKETTHRYGVNTFKLHRLPIPKLGNVVGLVGRNGTGKSTALKILSGDLIPNLGRFDNPPTWQESLKNLDHELRNYFTQIHTKKLKAIIKPQYVDDIRKKASDMIVGRILEQEDERGVKAEVCADLELNQLLIVKLESYLA
ncbi:ABC transporter E family member 2, partial [Tanacetum coccineum]